MMHFSSYISNLRASYIKMLSIAREEFSLVDEGLFHTGTSYDDYLQFFIGDYSTGIVEVTISQNGEIFPNSIHIYRDGHWSRYNK